MLKIFSVFNFRNLWWVRKFLNYENFPILRYSSSWLRFLEAKTLMNNIILTPVNIKKIIEWFTVGSSDSRLSHIIICIRLFSFLATTRNRICWRPLVESPTFWVVCKIILAKYLTLILAYKQHAFSKISQWNFKNQLFAKFLHPQITSTIRHGQNVLASFHTALVK